MTINKYCPACEKIVEYENEYCTVCGRTESAANSYLLFIEKKQRTNKRSFIFKSMGVLFFSVLIVVGFLGSPERMMDRAASSLQSAIGLTIIVLVVLIPVWLVKRHKSKKDDI